MTYIALYRKYRPKKFKDLVGQNVIIQTLKNAIKNKKINHCYLFSGDKGVGKTTLAQIFSKAINCSRFVEIDDCCEENDFNCCSFCSSIFQKKNLDIVEIDGASYSGIDEIRELKDKLFYKSNFLKYKIYIIDEIHVLTLNAFNALLKVLEETPPKVIFIFITSELNKIPKNFLSRIQYFYLNNILEEDIQKKLRSIALEEKINITDEALQKISFYSNENLREPLNLLDQVNSYTNSQVTTKDIDELLNLISKKKIEELFYHLSQNDIPKLISFLDDILLPKINLVLFLNDVINFFQKLVIDNFKEPNKNFFLKNLISFEKEKIFNKLLQLQDNLLLSKQKKNLLIIRFIEINEICNSKQSKQNKILDKKNVIINSNDYQDQNLKKETFVAENSSNCLIHYKKDIKSTFREDFLSNIINILNCENNSMKIFIRKGWKSLKNYYDRKLIHTARILFYSQLLSINNKKEALLSCRNDDEYRQFLQNDFRLQIKSILNKKQKLIEEYFVILDKDWKKEIEPFYLKFLQTKNEKDLDLSHFKTDFYEINSVLNINRNQSNISKLAYELFANDKIEIVD